MKYLLMIALLALTACGEKTYDMSKIPLTDGYTTVELQSIVKEVRDNYPAVPPHNVSHIVIVDKLVVEGRENSVGVARILDDGTKRPLEVLFDKTFWEQATHSEKVSLVAHELLHAEWSLEHTEYGLMHPHIQVSDYTLQELGLMETLFQALGY